MTSLFLSHFVLGGDESINNWKMKKETKLKIPFFPDGSYSSPVRSVWTSWSKCNRCGELGERFRLGEYWVTEILVFCGINPPPPPTPPPPNMYCRFMAV